MWDGKKWSSREGRFTKRVYSHKEGATMASPPQIGRNIANALKAAGASVIFQGDTEPPDRKEPLTGEYHVYGARGDYHIAPSGDYLLCAVRRRTSKKTMSASAASEIAAPGTR